MALINRILYATDASAYREMPEDVLFPVNREELVEIVKRAAREKIRLIPRAGGTSLAGQVVGSGVVVECSKYLNKIIEINREERWARVEPGVILDELNRAAAVHGLFFAPETSTSDRCCIAGMVGNNSCGSHSLIYGSTRDHLLEAEVLLSDGSTALFKSLSVAEYEAKKRQQNLEGDIYRHIERLASDNTLKLEIEANFPERTVKRRNCGYALDELLQETPPNLCKILSGSEGTLAMITELKLSLLPLPPKEKMLLCAHCASLEDAFRANLIALDHAPAAVELMDRNILELSKSNITQAGNRFFVEGDPAAILIIEFYAKSRNSTIAELEEQVSAAESELVSSGLSYCCTKVRGSDMQRVWALRKAGLGLLTTMKGDAKPVSVIEDTAVAPERLPAYLSDFAEMLSKFKLSCVYHAHIGSGELHLRPVLNLKEREDVKIFREVARETAMLVKKHRGSLSGEHGDGRLRGEFIPLMYGEYLYGVMRELKTLFDPHGIFNPGKIIDTPAMDTSLRYIPGAGYTDYDTYFDYSKNGGWLRAIEQCNGSGDCRKPVSSRGAMCPSFRATGDEKDSTRGRSNLLRELLSRPITDKIFDQKEILQSLDLCISCKACKSECPSNVDMAKYKAEFMQHHYDLSLIPPLRPYIVSRIAAIQKLGYRVAPLYNFFVSNRFTSALLKRIIGFSPSRAIPSLSHISLKRYVSKMDIGHISAPENSPHGRRVYLFADEFTDYSDTGVGISFVELLTALGYEVVIPKHVESGRAAISKGFIRRAGRLANKNVSLLKDIVNDESPLVGIEPSALLSFRDEYPDLVCAELKEAAKKLSENALLYDEFIMREVAAGRIGRELFTTKSMRVILHGHCHQRSLASVELSAKMLSLPENYTVELLPSGCCGMAGSFGFEKEHYAISVKIGEQGVFPLVRAAGEDVIVSAPGTSCRQQIFEATGKRVFHPVELLREALCLVEN